MEELPQDCWLPGLGREMTLWEARSLLALADPAVPVAAPGWDLLPALSAEGSQSLRPCGPLKGSQGITVWRKLPACPGEGEL